MLCSKDNKSIIPHGSVLFDSFLFFSLINRYSSKVGQYLDRKKNLCLLFYWVYNGIFTLMEQKILLNNFTKQIYSGQHNISNTIVIFLPVSIALKLASTIK